MQAYFAITEIFKQSIRRNNPMGQNGKKKIFCFNVNSTITFEFSTPIFIILCSLLPYLINTIRFIY